MNDSSKLAFYHGTTAEKARLIEKDGFKGGSNPNWQVASREEFIYLSLGYAPFYADRSKNGDGTLSAESALIKVEVDVEHLYPDDDFLMASIGRPVYTKRELETTDPEEWKWTWLASYEKLGCVAARSEDIRIVGVTYFDSTGLLHVSDPSITPMNYKFMGAYYQWLSDEIYKGTPMDEVVEMARLKYYELVYNQTPEEARESVRTVDAMHRAAKAGNTPEAIDEAVKTIKGGAKDEG